MVPIDLSAVPFPHLLTKDLSAAIAHNEVRDSSGIYVRGKTLLVYLTLTDLEVLNGETELTFVKSREVIVIDITVVDSSRTSDPTPPNLQRNSKTLV